MNARAVTIVTVLAILFPILLIGCALAGAAVGVRVGIVETARFVREGLAKA